MTKTQIIAAANCAIERDEGLQLWQAVEWLSDYGLMSYREQRWFMAAMTEARKNTTKGESA